jgi:hypothetical protein
MATYFHSRVLFPRMSVIDLRYGTAPMRWCHGVTLKFSLKFWAGNEMMLTVLTAILIWRRYFRPNERRYEWANNLANNSTGRAASG